jgi:hypothetical protein
MTTKDRTQVALYVPDEWIESIDEDRGDEPRNAWILEAIRNRLNRHGKRNYPVPPGRGRPKIKDSESS